MARLHEVPVVPRSLEQYVPLIGVEAVDEARAMADETRGRLAGRTVWNINSTAVGGGVAEMLHSILGYPKELGIDTRWVVIEGTPDFFAITKRLHHALHGSAGSAEALGDTQRDIYERVLAENAAELERVVEPGDLVVLHDPQTAGLAPRLLELGAIVIWRCHIGADGANPEVAYGWGFLAPYLRDVHVSVYSRESYVPEGLGGDSVVIPPSIDPFSAKNEDLHEDTVRAVLARIGVVQGPRRPAAPTFDGADGVPRRVERRAIITREGDPPSWDTPLVVQVSRWDPLKDPVGVMHGFAAALPRLPEPLPVLMLVGPEVTGVADDPESSAVLEHTTVEWRELPRAARERVQLVTLPTADVAENAVMVNAIQRHATAIAQKSLYEGFGLVVAEAMWKARPVVASRVGGIQDQIEHGTHGLLVDHPHDLDAFADALVRLLGDPEEANRMGQAARERVRREYLPVRHLLRYARLIEHCVPEA